MKRAPNVIYLPTPQEIRSAMARKIGRPLEILFGSMLDQLSEAVCLHLETWKREHGYGMKVREGVYRFEKQQVLIYRRPNDAASTRYECPHCYYSHVKHIYKFCHQCGYRIKWDRRTTVPTTTDQP